MTRIALFFLVLAPGVADAQEFDPGTYIGVGLASFSYQEHSVGTGNEFFDEAATARKLYGGYRFHKNWAVEATWQQTSTARKFFGVGFVGVINLVNPRSERDFEVITVRGVGFLPLVWGTPFIAVGYFDAQTDRSFEADGFPPAKRSISQDGLTLLGGVQWDVGRVSLRVEYEWWDVDAAPISGLDADTSAFGLGAHWRF